ncbi:hypothetical protein DUI87_20124 [Hirundo rustica rustica]|uniref:ribonuclease H n=1 Tax=Hirundo rustica rustica TaxID=333673 RepID=A0A3M0JRN0_HIRRU|nr:hypothetical protein DUI87_20124 [Hirundo rustica rustica]
MPVLGTLSCAAKRVQSLRETNLLGRDLQVQLGVGVIPKDGKMVVHIMKLTQGDIQEINPEVWATEGKYGCLDIPPIKIEMQKDTPAIRVKQYPMSPEGKKGLASVIEHLLKENILEPCMSSHNTPILAIKKDEGKFRLVQDLREINKRTIARHPVVPNPYTLLSKIPREHTWFTVIDLKDAFWACPLAEECRDWFAFEWEHPDRGRKQQLRWTRLPQGYTESPNIFGQALETLLEQFSPTEGVQILQYVDDLLISGETEKEVKNPFETREDYWEAPNHLFWICGDTAYTKLPGDWSGSCTIGIIKPAFFLLPKRLGAHLGVPVYDNLGKVDRKKRDTLTIGGDQKWKGKIWTPEEIIKTYGPATWAQDGSWGYRTPIYMLNRIIRLQAVLEMVSNRTALALDHISDQLTQTRAVIYQIRLAVDYLLADEGGICGKFNSSECCLEIDDKSAVIKNISKEIRKLAYVGNQEWTPLMDTNWWNSFWSFKGDWWKKAGFMIICSITGLMFLPCLIPFLIRTITSTVQASIQIPKATSQNKPK